MAGTICDNAAAYLTGMRELLEIIDHASINAAAMQVFRAWRQDRLVATLGNGGSAFTAGHFVTDLVKTAAVDGRRRLRAVSLADNIGLVTALGNDIGYEQSFAYTLESVARPKDLLIAISASGNSPNVLHACCWAKEHEVSVLGLTGFEGGELAAIADLNVNVPSDNYGIIEDLHLSIGHMISQTLRSLIQQDGTTS